MKYKASSAMGFGEPSDGLTDDEKALRSVIEQESLKKLYRKLPTNRMRFVVAAHFELGMTQELVAEILDIKQPSLQDEIAHIKRVLLGKPYKPQRRKATVQVKDIMNYLLLL